jgi:hypothetical protein
MAELFGHQQVNIITGDYASWAMYLAQLLDVDHSDGLVADLILPVFDGDTGDNYIPDLETKRKAASQSQHRFSSWEQTFKDYACYFQNLLSACHPSFSLPILK